MGLNVNEGYLKDSSVWSQTGNTSARDIYGAGSRVWRWENKQGRRDLVWIGWGMSETVVTPLGLWVLHTWVESSLVAWSWRSSTCTHHVPAFVCHDSLYDAIWSLFTHHAIVWGVMYPSFQEDIEWSGLGADTATPISKISVSWEKGWNQPHGYQRTNVCDWGFKCSCVGCYACAWTDMHECETVYVRMHVSV